MFPKAAKARVMTIEKRVMETSISTRVNPHEWVLDRKVFLKGFIFSAELKTKPTFFFL